MSLLNNNKNKKGGKKNPKSNSQGSKFIVKPAGKTPNVAQKTLRTGGTRGS
ncbi:MAG TPA: hypothetical protein VJT83_03290 [Chitinophagaceae bacterium]|nr:hypothetical protein [Chitinophagaceae bacterium]